MYGSHVVSTDYWRYHKPFAPDLEVSVVAGESVNVDLTPYWRQGARDYDEHFSPDPNVLPTMVPVQRGWLLDIILAVPSRKGIVLPNTYKNGFTYKPNVDTGNEDDCFNYQFSNGFQKSNYGKVTVKVIMPYNITWQINSPTKDVYYPNRDSNIYSMKLTLTPALPAYKFGMLRRVRWHIVAPEVYMKDGIPYIGTRDRVALETRYRLNSGSGGHSVSYIDEGWNLPSRTLTNDKHLVGIDEKTNAPYIPTGKFPSVYIEFLNYPRTYGVYGYTYIDFSYVERFVFKVEDYFGPRWHRSGKIQIGT